MKPKINRPTLLAAARGSAMDGIFGKESTKVEISEQEPTCNLRWHKGVLQQLWEITERHMHYSGDHYNHSTYHKREKWKAVDGAPNGKSSNPAASNLNR